MLRRDPGRTAGPGALHSERAKERALSFSPRPLRTDNLAECIH